jgi:tetratricopeptide (TPR) repeat protein
MAASADKEAASQLLIQALLRAGEYRRAEEALATLLKQAPDDPSALSLQADYFLVRSMGDQAETVYRRLYEKDARRLFAGIALAKLMARRRETEAAQTLLMDIAQRLPKPEDIPPPSTAGFYEPWETLESRDAVRRLRVDFHQAMAEVYGTRYLLPDAEREIQLALQLLPRSLPARRALTEIKRLGGDASERLAAARGAAEVFPEHPEVLMDLAQALAAAGRPPEALTYAQASAAACPALSRAQAVLAEARLAAGDKTAAAQAASKAEELNDRDPETYLADGLVKAARGDWREAEATFGKAVELDPFLARAHWERARALDKLNKKRPARADRDKALELEPRVFAGKM